MAPPNIYLVKVTDSTVAGGNSDVLELHVHVVFSCALEKHFVSIQIYISRQGSWGEARILGRVAKWESTLDQLPSINLSGGNLERYDMILINISFVSFLQVLGK